MGDEELRAVGVRVRELRSGAGWSGRELARRAEVAQAAVSRVENGRRVSGPMTAERIIAALPISPAMADDLRAHVQDAYALSGDRRVDAGFSLVSDVARKWEMSAGPVRAFQSAMVPRALRTADYGEAAEIAVPDPSGRVGGPGRAFDLVMTEGALRTWPGDGAVMPAQLDHLVTASTWPNVRLGVVPWSVPLPVVPPHGFTLHNDEAVTVETFTAEMTITEPDAVAAYIDAYSQLEAVAVIGDEARELIERIRRDFEELAY